MAPEVMKGEPVSLSSDVFSYGMLLYEILTGELPFADAKTDVVAPPIPVDMKSYLADTLKQCWNANPKARPSFHDILECLTKRVAVTHTCKGDERPTTSNTDDTSKQIEGMQAQRISTPFASIDAKPQIPSVVMDTLPNLYIHHERATWPSKERHLPVTLVTGYLGAGKTTLLNHILTNKHNLKIAAVVNDFAEINIDSQIVRRNRPLDSVIELTNGCLCCSISGEFQTAVWKLLQDADIDYLLIETSGVTDPHETIATLEKDYGRMYRIRLDTIITVVDTDALVARITQGDTVLSGAAADSQLKCADVILLNKRDLVSEEQLKKAKEFIREYTPGVQVYSCLKCAVPLHYIMEVNEVSASPLMTAAAYTVSAGGGVMNRERQKRLKNMGDSTESAQHLFKDEFSSFAFESSEPFSLGAFQVFLGSRFPTGVSRIKGTIWFEENRACLYSFHMNGRQRYEILPCARVSESLTGAFPVQLVAIGRAIDTDTVRHSMEQCLASKNQESVSVLHPSYQSARALIVKDDRFQLIGESFNVDSNPNHRCVDFRLTGIAHGKTTEETSSIYRIDFTKMNLELAKRVNGSNGPVSILPVLLPTGMQVCRHAIYRDVSFDVAWKLVQDIAKSLL